MSEKSNAIKITYWNKRDLITIAKVSSPVLFVIIVGFVWHEFVLSAIEANLPMNCIIIGAALFGVILIIARLLDVLEDYQIIERFSYHAGQGVYMQTLLNEPWLKNRYVRHYLSHIANTGGTLSSELQYSSIESELESFKQDYNSRLELPQFIVGFMIALGLLGTFIGLLETLTGISKMLDSIGGSGSDMQKQFMSLVGELRKPLAGMGIAFSASMFGLITSLMLAIMMTNLRHYIARVTALARNVMHELTEIVQQKGKAMSGGGFSPTDIDAMMKTGNSAQNATSAGSWGKESLAVGSSSLTGQLSVLIKKIETMTETLETNADIGRKTYELISFGPRMRELSEKTLEELRHINIGMTEQNKMSKLLTSTNSEIAQLTTSMLDSYKHAYTQQQSVMQSLVEAHSGIIHEVSSMGEKHQHMHAEQQSYLQSLVVSSKDNNLVLSEILETQRHDSVNRQRETHSVVTAAGDTVRGIINLIELHKQNSSDSKLDANAAAEFYLDIRRMLTDIRDNHTQGRTDLGEAIGRLIQHLTDIKDVDLRNSHHLNDMKEVILKLRAALPMLDLIANGVTGQGPMMETLADEIRHLIALIQQNISDNAR